MNQSLIFPVEPWHLSQFDWQPDQQLFAESLLSLGNGHLGTRATLEEGYPHSVNTLEGTYINGFYATHPIEYGESAYGFAKNNHAMIAVADTKQLCIQVDHESVTTGTIQEFERRLHLQDGLLSRNTIWKMPNGGRVQLDIERFIHADIPELMCAKIKVTSLDHTQRIKLSSGITKPTPVQIQNDDPRIGEASHLQAHYVEQWLKDGHLGCLQSTENQQLITLFHQHADQSLERHLEKTEQGQRQTVESILSPGRSITLTQLSIYATGTSTALYSVAESILGSALAQGYQQLKASHQKAWLSYWSDADIQLVGDDALQQGIRLNGFHLRQSCGRFGKTSIAAKGLSGPGYDGHYFWDSEIYALPYFLYTEPHIARRLIEYRISKLDHARHRAKIMSHKHGALYPWRTIGGEEVSAFFPAGTAQYHINADIAWALKQYIQATGDTTLLIDGGAEMLFETARIWPDLGRFRDDGQFSTHEVTGPDEYSCMVDNNFYTNLMAQTHLSYALDVRDWLLTHAPEKLKRLQQSLQLNQAEFDLWGKIMSNICLPYDSEQRIFLQDDAFCHRPVWDFQNTPSENYPLLLHYHPLVIYRHQVCKQADVLMAHFLEPSFAHSKQKDQDFAFYEPITTHDSSLSPIVHSVIASEIGQHDKAYQYFSQTARLDIDNLHQNSGHGVHIACMAGTWIALVKGFAGMRFENNRLSFSPSLPHQWQAFTFRMYIQKVHIEVTVGSTCQYTLLTKGQFELFHFDHKVSLGHGVSVSCSIYQENHQ
ncbi:glycoside hydrolase family 65 protein [Algicola sagamiensis]|uniref:glycoside hydrolase family 65 protein n=1 Tax=Algicola sagamiensis TaxID=163869 RepID=UPI000380B764|nr:glycosyl hydrolase family 65 protein [Algicola sagamiensis]